MPSAPSIVASARSRSRSASRRHPATVSALAAPRGAGSTSVGAASAAWSRAVTCPIETAASSVGSNDRSSSPRSTSSTNQSQPSRVLEIRRRRCDRDGAVPGAPRHVAQRRGELREAPRYEMRRQDDRALVPRRDPHVPFDHGAPAHDRRVVRLIDVDRALPAPGADRGERSAGERAGRRPPAISASRPSATPSPARARRSPEPASTTAATSTPSFSSSSPVTRSQRPSARSRASRIDVERDGCCRPAARRAGSSSLGSVADSLLRSSSVAPGRLPFPGTRRSVGRRARSVRPIGQAPTSALQHLGHLEDALRGSGVRRSDVLTGRSR